jgi:hypothetical protein
MLYKFILFISLTPQSFCLNALFISLGTAGHVIPMFELSKSMKYSNITFLTQQLAQFYIDFKSYSSPLFHIIYDNDSSDALLMEKTREEQLSFYLSNNSLFDAIEDVGLIIGQMSLSLTNKTIYILMNQQFDVIIASAVISGIPILCKETNTPCVLQMPMTLPSFLDFNIPNVYHQMI